LVGGDGVIRSAPGRFCLALCDGSRAAVLSAATGSSCTDGQRMRALAPDRGNRLTLVITRSRACARTLLLREADDRLARRGQRSDSRPRHVGVAGGAEAPAQVDR